MLQPVKKRGATPLMVQRLWASVDHVRQQKQIPNRERIIRYITRAHNVSAEEAETELIRAVKDGLLMAYTAVGNKGSKVGKEQEGYKNPETDPEWGKGSSDWYCFDCHKAGEIIQCSDCWRVYHQACMGDTEGDSTFTCAYCKTSKRQGRMKRKELNKLLSFVIIRLKEKAKELHRLLHRDGEELLDRLVYRHMDLNMMEAKTEDRKYKYLDQFQADAHNIIHNIIICYGEHSGMAELARIMIRDCKYDLDEIRKCKDCYYYSNAKPADWFCKPCRPPHELVYAKQKGYSYWPAKVIKAEADGFDVRFFGGRHERAVIPEGQLKSINLSQKELDLKKTSGFMRALAELHQHQALLKEMEGRLSSEAASEPEQSPEDGEVEEEEEEEDEKPPPKKRRKVERERKKRKRSRVKEEEDGEEEEGEISSSNTMPDESGGKQQVRSPEDTHMVSSSVDNAYLPKPTPTASVATQTCKKLHNMGKLPSRATQTDGEIASKGCNCEEKYSEVFKSFKTRLAEDHERDKKKALQELTDRLHKDFEEDKQQAVSRAMNKMSQELERVQRQTEEQCKQQYMDEMKALAQKHKDHISAVKKKQWCFNCEEEAMYHCCWNTSYCSIKCQQEHWHKEHKRVCRRKR